jgi:hypothetical protein
MQDIPAQYQGDFQVNIVNEISFQPFTNFHGPPKDPTQIHIGADFIDCPKGKLVVIANKVDDKAGFVFAVKKPGEWIEGNISIGPSQTVLLIRSDNGLVSYFYDARGIQKTKI